MHLRHITPLKRKKVHLKKNYVPFSSVNPTLVLLGFELQIHLWPGKTNSHKMTINKNKYLQDTAKNTLCFILQKSFYPTVFKLLVDVFFSKIYAELSI